MGTRKIGPGGRRRLHDDGQAGPPDAAVDAHPGRACWPRPACPTACCRCCRPTTSGRLVDAAPRRSPAAQAVVHRLHRGGPGAAAPGRRPGAARRRWSSAATPRSSCSTTPTSTPRSRGRWWPRCATSARRARRPTASSSHDAVADEFAERLADRMGALKVGRGTEPGVEVGPLIDDAGADQGGRAGRRGGRRGVDAARRAAVPPRPRLLLRADRARRRARRRPHLRGGDLRPGGAGIAASPPTTRRSPLANDTEYGLVSYVYTDDLMRALRVCERLETGMIGLNQGMVSNPAAPFGGVKQSGLGREGGAGASTSTWRPSTWP